MARAWWESGGAGRAGLVVWAMCGKLAEVPLGALAAFFHHLLRRPSAAGQGRGTSLREAAIARPATPWAMQTAAHRRGRAAAAEGKQGGRAAATSCWMRGVAHVSRWRISRPATAETMGRQRRGGGQRDRGRWGRGLMVERDHTGKVGQLQLSAATGSPSPGPAAPGVMQSRDEV
jgi:hypothetical protein